MSDEDLTPPERKVKAEPQQPPRHLKKERVRICGRWRKKGYTPTREEIRSWQAHCKSTNRDPKTGQIKSDKTAAKTK